MNKTRGSISRRRWPRILSIAGAGMVAAYLVLTSGWFVKSVVLPSLGSSLGGELTAEEVSLSPFSSLRAKGVRLRPNGRDTLLELGGLEARYALLSILAGTIKVDELTLESPVVSVISRKGGPSNLEAWMKAMPRSAPSRKQRPPGLAIGHVGIKGGALRMESEDDSGRLVKVSVGGLGLDLDRLVSNVPSRVKLQAAVEMESGPGAASGRVAGRLDGDVSFTLKGDLGVDSIGSAIRIAVAEGSGSMERFKGLAAAFEVGLGPTVLTNALLRFTQGGASLGEARVRGQVNLAEPELRLAYDVTGLDSRVLALVAAASGLDVGNGSVSASGRVDLLNSGSLLVMEGKLNGTNISAGTIRGRTRPADVNFLHRVTVNRNLRSVICEQLDLGASQGGRVVLSGALDNGLNISWDKTAAGFRDSTYTVKASGLRLEDLAVFLPVESLGGVLDADAKVKVEDAGRTCSFSASFGGDGWKVAFGGRTFPSLALQASVQGRLRDFNMANIDALDLKLRMAGSSLASVSAIADWRMGDGYGGAQMDAELALPAVLGLVPVEGVALRSGRLKTVISAGIRPTGPVVDVMAYWNDITGRVVGIDLDGYDATLSVSVAHSGRAYEVRKVSVTGQSGTLAGGTIDAFGSFNPDSLTGSLTLNVMGVNQSLLGPLVAPYFAPNKLAGVLFNGAAKADLDIKGKSSVTGSLRMADMIVLHPQGRFPQVPLGCSLEFEGTHAGATTEIRHFVLALDPTERATNRIDVSGVIHAGAKPAAASRLSLKSTDIDLTPLYDLLSSATNAVKPAVASGEPAPVHLPVRELLADVDVPRVFLGDIEVRDIAAKVQVKDDVISVENLGFRLNGSPVKTVAKVDLGKPGYDYALSLTAEPIPLKPIFNTFVPAMKELAQGAFVASADIRGSGTTGASLRKSLAGHLQFRATNAEIRLPDGAIEVPALFSKYFPILPERLHPASVLAAIGKSDMVAEPFRVLEMRADIGDGTVRLTEGRALSAAIAVQVGGEVRIADELDQSALEIPVALGFGSKGAQPSPRNIGKAIGTLAKPSFKPDIIGMGAVIGSLTLPGVGKVGDKAGEALKAAGSGLNQAAGKALEKAGAAVEAAVGKDGKAPGKAIGGFIEGVLGNGGKAVPNAAPGTPAKRGQQEPAPGTQGPK